MRDNTYTYTAKYNEGGSNTRTNIDEDELIGDIIEFGFMSHPELEYAVNIYNKDTAEKTRLVSEAILISPEYPEEGKHSFEIFEHIDNKLVKLNFEKLKPFILEYLIEYYSDSKVLHSS